MNDLNPRIPTDELTPGVSAGGPLESAIADFAAAAVRAKGIDPLVTELVRLRCAQYHDCRLCASFRVQEALDAGYEESMHKAIGNYENSDFSPKIKAALRLCDAMIMRPGDIPEAVALFHHIALLGTLARLVLYACLTLVGTEGIMIEALG